MTEIGPIQLLAIGFGPDAPYQGQLMDELERLDGQGVVRVLDLLFLGQDRATGEVVALEYQGDDLGALVGALLQFEFVGADAPAAVVGAAVGEASVGISRAHLEQLLREAPPEVAMGLVLIEHVWARDLKRAIREAGGIPLAEGFLSPEVLAEIAVELAATVEVMEELEREQEQLDASATAG